MPFDGETHVHVYQSKITAFSYPGGMVWKWAYQRRRKIERMAKLYAPKRTGTLARSISGDYEKVPNGVVMYVTAGASYGRYVHEGTGHWAGRSDIVSPFGRKMHLQPAWGGHPDTYRWKVRGQRPNPFLEEALKTVMRDL